MPTAAGFHLDVYVSSVRLVPVTTNGLRLLLTPHGQEFLAGLPPYDPAQALKLGEKLRRTHDPDLVAAALSQQALRERARGKLGDFADTMFFTEAGLQQATRLEVAAHHARRYRDAGVARVFDLGCGLGVDSLALAGLGLEVCAVEMDETTAALALLNLRPFPNAQVIHGDALDVAQSQVTAEDGIFSDPARRSGAGRIFDPAAYSPPLDAVLALRSLTAALGVKTAPGIGYDHIPAEAHAQWVSVRGEVVEAGLWFGPLASAPGRSALVITGSGSATLHASDDPRSPAATVEIGGLGRYLVEPDGAVIRAGGTAALAAQIGAVGISEKIAYLTSEQPYFGPFGETFEILEHFPYSRTRLAAWCHAHGIGSLEIKKRGVDVVPDELRRTLKLQGSAAATVILTRVRGRHSAIVARRTTPARQ